MSTAKDIKNIFDKEFPTVDEEELDERKRELIFHMLDICQDENHYYRSENSSNQLYIIKQIVLPSYFNEPYNKITDKAIIFNISPAIQYSIPQNHILDEIYSFNELPTVFIDSDIDEDILYAAYLERPSSGFCDEYRKFRPCLLKLYLLEMKKKDYLNRDQKIDE